MAQLNIYLPTPIDKKLRTAAKKKGKSLSKYISELFESNTTTKTKWPKDFFTKVIGKWQGDFPEIDDPIPSDIETL